MTKQAAQRNAAQAAVDLEEALEAERERRRAARERRADKVRAIEDVVAADERRKKIALVRSSLGLTKEGVKEGTRKLAASGWDGCAAILFVGLFLAIASTLVNFINSSGLTKDFVLLAFFIFLVAVAFGKDVAVWLLARLRSLFER